MLVAVLVRFTNFTDDLLTHGTGTILSKLNDIYALNSLKPVLKHFQGACRC